MGGFSLLCDEEHRTDFRRTAFHWHGIRMLNNNVNDGANGVTECPIPPGASKVYRFRAEQYGTSWYVPTSST